MNKMSPLDRPGGCTARELQEWKRHLLRPSAPIGAQVEGGRRVENLVQEKPISTLRVAAFFAATSTIVLTVILAMYVWGRLSAIGEPQVRSDGIAYDVIPPGSKDRPMAGQRWTVYEGSLHCTFIIKDMPKIAVGQKLKVVTQNGHIYNVSITDVKKYRILEDSITSSMRVYVKPSVPPGGKILRVEQG